MRTTVIAGMVGALVVLAATGPAAAHAHTTETGSASRVADGSSALATTPDSGQLTVETLTCSFRIGEAHWAAAQHGVVYNFTITDCIGDASFPATISAKMFDVSRGDKKTYEVKHATKAFELSDASNINMELPASPAEGATCYNGDAYYGISEVVFGPNDRTFQSGQKLKGATFPTCLPGIGFFTP
jgi:hypothetical protein